MITCRVEYQLPGCTRSATKRKTIVNCSIVAGEQGPSEVQVTRNIPRAPSDHQATGQKMYDKALRKPRQPDARIVARSFHQLLQAVVNEPSDTLHTK
jgi:hypothetical protein